MIALHAPDAPGQLAHKASQFADVVSFNLQASRSPHLDAGKRREALERVFTAWPMLCRAMSELEEAAPRSAAAGAHNAANLREMAERADERSRGTRQTPQAVEQISRDGH